MHHAPAELLRAAVRRRADLGPLALSLWLLPWFVLRVRLGRSRVVVRAPRAEDTACAPHGTALARARRLARVVELASRYGLASGNCLSRSLTLLALLDRERLSGELRIGIRGPRDTFEAHAWVEHDGVVLNDDAAVDQRFTRLEDIRAVTRDSCAGAGPRRYIAGGPQRAPASVSAAPADDGASRASGDVRAER